MLKENWRLVSRIERLGDLLIIICSFFFAYFGRSSLLYWNQKFKWELPFAGLELAPLQNYYIVLIIAMLVYLIVLEVMGAYSSMRLSSSFNLLKLSFLSSFFSFFAISTSLYILKLDLSRSFIALFCIIVTLAITLERYVILELLRFWRKRGKNFRNIVVVGVGEQAARLAHEISMRPELGLRILGFAHLKEGTPKNTEIFGAFREKLRAYGCVRIGRLFVGRAELESSLNEHAVDEVIFTDVIEVMPQVEEMIVICAEQGIRTTIAADLFSIGLVKSGISYFGAMPLIHFQTPPGDKWELALKRYLDIALSLFLLLVLSPVFLVLALLVKFGSKGPSFFSQTRVGLNGRQFKMYKFRSMYLGAEKKLHELKAHNEMDGPVFKLKNDPRVTWIGKILRRFSLDELPQLWNVLRGDMSLVGPRPPVPGEVSMYERRDRRRLSMRPGMTCIWQVSGRSEIRDFESWVKLDLEYIDNWSLVLDLILLARTIPAVLFGVGAR